VGDTQIVEQLLLGNDLLSEITYDSNIQISNPTIIGEPN